MKNVIFARFAYDVIHLLLVTHCATIWRLLLNFPIMQEGLESEIEVTILKFEKDVLRI